MLGAGLQALGHIVSLQGQKCNRLPLTLEPLWGFRFGSHGRRWNLEGRDVEGGNQSLLSKLSSLQPVAAHVHVYVLYMCASS